MNVSAFLEHLRCLPTYQEQIVFTHQVPPRPSCPGELDRPLHPSLQGTLQQGGLWPLYRHQAQAVNAMNGGAHVMVATPAASGKSLCYHLPVLEALLHDPRTRALYLYPAKALAQDQLRNLQQLVPPEASARAEVFDGDTPPRERAAIKRGARILLTNPDMLHLGILPNHRSWARFFQGLRFVVLDEAHTYRGVFGSHVANVLRRLRRLCQRYGSAPQFILCSATIANPGELAERLTGLPFQVVDEDGSPSGGKRFLFWNPPFTDETHSARRSASTEAACLLTELAQQRIRTLTFVRTRRLAELVSLYTREQLAQRESSLASRISPYRAGYLSQDRRRIEQALFQGELLGVVATNALELGIDIGDLDATVLTGYPGSIASTWQQAGRSGRRGEESLSILVGQDNPLDQYLMRHPQTFFGKPTEHALISPENPYILAPHLLCAAYETPLEAADTALFGESLEQRAAELVGMGLLRSDGGRWYLDPSITYPAEEVNIRSTSREQYLLLEEETGRVLETLEQAAAFLQAHPGAIYLHQGEPYRVERLDLTAKIASVVRADGSYYTQASDITDIRIRRLLQHKLAGGVGVYLGEVEVSNLVVGYKKRAPLTEEVLDEEPLDLPPTRFPTVALWFDIPQELMSRALAERWDLAGGLHAAEHAAIGVLPLFTLCDRNDIGGVSTPLHPDTGRPQVFIYDGHPGGIGITERGYQLIEELWAATGRVVRECPCTDGCPSCIQSPKCGNNNQPLDKRVCLTLLETLLAGVPQEGVL
ncbi:MAG: DEAD/DEAH box helicase [Dehalococcoidia bacterium]